jgi:type II secretory pathway pseudopilin PulG
MLSRLIRTRQIQAFTLTEFMVSFGILAILVLVLVFGVGRFRSTQRNEQLRIDFLNSLTTLRAEFKKDVEIALLNNSPTAEVNITADAQNRFYGIGTNVDSADQFSFQVFKPLHQSLTLPVTLNSTTNTLRIVPPQAASTTPNNERDYLRKALTSGKYFVVSNQTAQAIFEKPVSSPSNNISSLTLGSNQALTTFGPQFTAQSNLIRTAEKITFNWNQSSKVLTRTSDYRTDASPAQDVIFSNVVDFRVGYTFRLRQDSGVADTAIVPTPPTNRILSALNLPNTLQEAWTESNCVASSGQKKAVVNGAIIPSCVKPKNIDRVYVHLKVQTDLPVDQWTSVDAGIEGLRVRFDGGTKTALVDFELTSRAFSLMSSSLATGTDITCQPNSGSHCKPQCSQIFTSLNQNDANWIGYGRYRGHPQGASDYCLCWTDHRTNQVEGTFEGSAWRGIGTWSLIPTWSVNGDNTPENNQVEACGRHYGCSVQGGFLQPDSRPGTPFPGRVIHPGYRAACECLQGPNQDYFINRTNGPRFESATGPQVGGFLLTAQLAAYKGDSTSSNPYLDPRDRHLNCANYNSCGTTLDQYFGTTSSNLAQQAMTNRCGCLTQNIPYACDTRKSQAEQDASCTSASASQITFSQLDFARICNREFRNSSGALACPNTWAPENFSGNVTVPAWTQNLNMFQTNNSSSPTPRYNIENATSNISLARRFGISQTVAEACECLENNVAGQFTSTGFQSNNSGSGNIYPATLAAGIADLDFRTPAPNPNAVANLSNPSWLPINPWFPTSNQPPQNYPTYGSNASGTVPSYSFVTTDNPGNSSFNTALPANTCSANHCTLLNNSGPGCCLAQQPTNLVSVNDQLESWNGFCRSENDGPTGSRCTSPSLNGRGTQGGGLAIAEIITIRSYITQRAYPGAATASTQNLPIDCGGQQIAGSGGM